MRVVVLIFLFPFLCISQQSIDANQFFELGLSRYKEGEKVVAEKVNFSWIDRYELRTETSDFDLNEQEYTFRVSPSTPKIRNAQKAYYEELINAPDFDGQEIYCDLKFSLHIDWLSLFMLNENKKALNELLLILNDKQSIFEKMMGSYEFDTEKILKLQTEKSDMEIELNKMKLEQDYLFNKYNIQSQDIEFGGFITIERIADYLSKDILTANQSEMIDLESAYKKQLLMREMDIKSSEKKKLIDFVQLKYNGPHSDLLSERLSIGLGFQLFTASSAKLKMEELRIEIEELNRKSARDIEERQEKAMTTENMLRSDVEAFLKFQEVMEVERGQLQKLSGKISQKEGTSPLLLLDIEKRHLMMKIKSHNKKEDLLRDYLKYLRQNDKMCQSDFINYLN